MNYQGGTKAAKAFIHKYKELGLLADIYSDDWIRRNSVFQDLCMEEISDFQKENGDSFKGHLLVIFAAHELAQSVDLNKDLVAVYPKFGDYFGAVSRALPLYKHEPDFIFINLATKKILLAGLGRKNKIFLIDAETGISLSYDEIINNQISSDSRSYFKEFTRLDAAYVVSSILSTLVQIGDQISAIDALGYSPDELEQLSAEDPNAEGLYETDSGDLLSPEEREDLLGGFDRCNSYLEEMMEDLQIYFPLDFDVTTFDPLDD